MSKAKHYITAIEDRIPIGQKTAYAIGMLVNNLQAAALPAMIVILNLGLGMDPLLVALIGFAPRIVDAVSDVLMGYISDNTRSRFGRRRPYIFGGVIVAGIIYAIMWQLPIGYIDIAAKQPIRQHEGVAVKGVNYTFEKGKPVTLNYDTKRELEGSFVFYGPNSLALAGGPAFATNLENEFTQAEVDIEAIKGQSIRVIFNEAEDGESYYIDPTPIIKGEKKENKAIVLLSKGIDRAFDGLDKVLQKFGVELSEEIESLEDKKEERIFYRFDLSELKRDTSSGNQNGNGHLDLQSMNNITVTFTGLSGSGMAAVHSLKLRKSEDFYNHYFWYFMAMSIFFFLAYTVFAVPFNALGYEMTPDYHERTKLQAVAQWAGQIAWIVSPWFWWFVYNEELFEGPVEGARILAIAVGIFIAVFGIVPAIFNREKFGSLPKDKDKVGILKNTKEFFKGFAITFKCKPFVKLCAVTFLVFNGFQLGISFSIYVMVFYVFGGDRGAAGSLQGWFGTVSVLGTMIVVIPLLTWISSKLGKKETLMITLSLATIGYVLKWFCYDPGNPYMLLYSAPIIAFGIGSLFTLMGSMVADVCDYDELVTGERREGIFSAIYWWMVKIGMSMAALMTGILLKTSGFDEALGTGNSVKTLFYLRVFDISVPIITFVIAILIISTYKLSEARSHEIRAELEKRRGKR